MNLEEVCKSMIGVIGSALEKVCMCVCVYVCVYACVYVCVCARE